MLRRYAWLRNLPEWIAPAHTFRQLARRPIRRSEDTQTLEFRQGYGVTILGVDTHRPAAGGFTSGSSVVRR